MPLWKKNLIVCWFGVFITGIGLSEIAPVLSLYIRMLGVHSTSSVEELSGLAYGATFVIAAIFSPIWGLAADKFGRKPMLLRASLGMAVVLFVMGLVHNVYTLIFLRFLEGTISGYTTACTTLIATQVDKEHAGYALGAISTANITGSLIGPTLAGIIEEAFGIRYVFLIISILLMAAFVTTVFFVKEDFERDTKIPTFKETWMSIPEKRLTIVLFLTFFMIMLGVNSIEPIVTEYVRQLSGGVHIALIAGLVFSACGISNIIAAPQLGKLSDRVGPHKVMLIALIIAGILFIPQAFVKNPWQLLVLRFLLGFAIAGLNPSVNTMIKKITPNNITGRVFGFSMSASYLGAFGGSVVGGQIAGYFGIRSVFFITSALMLFNAVCVYFNIYRKLKSA